MGNIFSPVKENVLLKLNAVGGPLSVVRCHFRGSALGDPLSTVRCRGSAVGGPLSEVRSRGSAVGGSSCGKFNTRKTHALSFIAF